MDVDLLVDTALENEARVIAAVARLPDHAAAELRPGELAEFVVVRVADEIVVDLMASASGFVYAEACDDVDVHEIDGVAIPFASPRLLYRMKRSSLRDKDAPDIQFLKQLLERRGALPE